MILRLTGGVIGFAVMAGVVVWLGVALYGPAVEWLPLIVGAFVMGVIGAQFGSCSPLPIWEHKFLLRYLPLVGAFAGFFAGIYLVMGFPARGDFGVRVYAACGLLALVGLLIPLWLIQRFVAVFCPQCKGALFCAQTQLFSKDN